MTRTPFGLRLQERTQPLAPDDADYGNAHAILCEALSKPFLQVQEVFDPEDDVPPVAPLLSPDLCPDWALPWLAQLVGITIPTGTSADTARGLIQSVWGFRRGTPAAIEAAVQAVLTGDKTVWFRERDGSAYRLEVVTLDGELPETDRTLTNGIKNPRPTSVAGWWGGAPPDAPVLTAVADSTSPTGYAVNLKGAITSDHWARIVPITSYTLAAPAGGYVGGRISGRAAADSTEIRMAILWLDGAGNEVGSTFSNAVPTTKKWQSLGLTAAVPAGAVSAVPAVEFHAQVGVLDAYASAALIATVEKGRIPDYGDGSRPGWAWNGAADNSTSTRTPTTIVAGVLTATKPAGIVLNYRHVLSWDYQQLVIESAALTYKTLKPKYATYRTLRDHQPV